MKNKRFKLFKKGFLINQLMQLYSLILVVVILIIMIGLSLFVIETRIEEAKNTVDNISAELVSNIKNKDSSVVSNILGEVIATPSKYENAYNYLALNQQNYFNYMLNLWHETGVSEYFPDIMRTLFINYTDIKSIDIVLDDYDEYLHGDRVSTLGKKIKKPYVKPTSGLTLIRSIQDPATSQTKGTIYVTFTDESLVSSYSENQNSKQPVVSYIFNAQNELVYESKSGLPKNTLNQIESDLTKKIDLNVAGVKGYYARSVTMRGLTLVMLISKKDIRNSLIQTIFFIVMIGFSAMALLLIFLNRIFKKYSHQMEEIVQVTNQVSQGDLTAQVNTDIMELELKDLAEAINQMVINLNAYIEDIYALEIKQRDAHMKALQAQINPHFLYNTLEYIRMYALSNQQTELADVVYAFSALLRNNITQEKTTTLKEELDFCEKYVYLYQMRYPDSIAYHFVMDDELDQLIVPKFIIQPLIENYFVHGIDFERQDNAISVKAKKIGNQVEIRISDNGIGMTKERLDEVNQKLVEKATSDGSIGIVNVYERLKGYFGESAEMWVEKGIRNGVTIVLKIKQE